MKYEYYIHVWGGFFNDEYKRVHCFQPGNYFFDTLKEREDFISTLREIEEKMDARHLGISMSEGYHCRIETKLHRVTKYNGKEYYSEYNLGCSYPIDAAKYHMENKWYPGFNDYPMGEDFDYHKKKFKVVQEWITGAFSDKHIFDKL